MVSPAKSASPVIGHRGRCAVRFEAREPSPNPRLLLCVPHVSYEQPLVDPQDSHTKHEPLGRIALPQL